MAHVYHSQIVAKRNGLVLVIPDELAKHMGLKVGTELVVYPVDKRMLIVELV